MSAFLFSLWLLLTSFNSKKTIKKICVVGRKTVLLLTLCRCCAILRINDDRTEDPSKISRRSPTAFCQERSGCYDNERYCRGFKKGTPYAVYLFKNKEQIYMAVVKSELEMLSDTMEKVAQKDIPPDEKILQLISTHLDIVKLAVYRNGTLRANFFRDIWRVEAMRKHFDANEMKLFRTVLKEGKEQGLFDIDNVEITADILHYCIKGIEVPYIRGQIGEDLDDEIGWRYVAKIVYGALGRKL